MESGRFACATGIHRQATKKPKKEPQASARACRHGLGGPVRRHAVVEVAANRACQRSRWPRTSGAETCMSHQAPTRAPPRSRWPRAYAHRDRGGPEPRLPPWPRWPRSSAPRNNMSQLATLRARRAPNRCRTQAPSARVCCSLPKCVPYAPERHNPHSKSRPRRASPPPPRRPGRTQREVRQWRRTARTRPTSCRNRPPRPGVGSKRPAPRSAQRCPIPQEHPAPLPQHNPRRKCHNKPLPRGQ